jgi:hypothetical protein
MAELKGLRDYLDASYDDSVFNTITNSQETWSFHLHGQTVITGKLLENQQYDIRIGQDEKETILQKIEIKLAYPHHMAERILPLIKKKDKKVAQKKLEPIIEVKNRHFIKNKTLYPLMMEKEVVYFTLLEGEIIRGIITGFTRFDITMGLKGGVPLTFFRHSIFDARNKKGRCFLKATQQVSRDWKKSALFSD